MLHGCAQPERAPEPESTQPPSAPTVPPPSEATVQPLPAPSVAQPRPPSIEPSPPPTDQSAPAPPASADAAKNKKQRGRISMYGRKFSGKKTASGEPFDPADLTMAHRTLPFGTRVRVTNLENQRSVEVVVNDRGPFVPGRIADLSTAAARRINMVGDGVVEAVLEVVELAAKH
jgi:rare lipoprotein A